MYLFIQPSIFSSIHLLISILKLSPHALITRTVGQPLPESASDYQFRTTPNDCALNPEYISPALKPCCNTQTSKPLTSKSPSPSTPIAPKTHTLECESCTWRIKRLGKQDSARAVAGASIFALFVNQLTASPDPLSIDPGQRKLETFDPALCRHETPNLKFYKP